MTKPQYSNLFNIKVFPNTSRQRILIHGKEISVKPKIRRTGVFLYKVYKLALSTFHTNEFIEKMSFQLHLQSSLSMAF